MTIPPLISTEAGIKSFSGSPAVVGIATEPGDLCILWLFNRDPAGEPFHVTFDGITLAPLEEDIGAGKDRSYALFAATATTTSSAFTYRYPTDSFPRSALYIVDVIRRGAIDVHSSSMGPGGNTFDTATLSTSGTIPGVVTTGPDRLVRHYVGGFHGNISFGVPRWYFTAWANGTLDDFVAPEPEFYHPATDGFFESGVGATVGALESPGPTGDVAVTTDDPIHWVYACLAIHPKLRRGMTVGSVRF